MLMELYKLQDQPTNTMTDICATLTAQHGLVINSRAEKPTHMGAYAQMFAPSTHRRAHYVSDFTHGLKKNKQKTPHMFTHLFVARVPWTQQQQQQQLILGRALIKQRRTLANTHGGNVCCYGFHYFLLLVRRRQWFRTDWCGPSGWLGSLEVGDKKDCYWGYHLRSKASLGANQFWHSLGKLAFTDNIIDESDPRRCNSEPCTVYWHLGENPIIKCYLTEWMQQKETKKTGTRNETHNGTI